jgi:DNA-binding NarL/FixJ family response regulator
MRILLADDNPEVRSALRLLLEQESLQIFIMEVSDAHGLQETLIANCPRIVLLDWELPGMHASDILAKLQSRCPKIKVIALSSKFEARQAALAAGVDAFVSKAEPPEMILSALRLLISDPQDHT